MVLGVEPGTYRIFTVTIATIDIFLFLLVAYTLLISQNNLNALHTGNTHEMTSRNFHIPCTLSLKLFNVSCKRWENVIETCKTVSFLICCLFGRRGFDFQVHSSDSSTNKHHIEIMRKVPTKT